jgi:hypothetical protein
MTVLYNGVLIFNYLKQNPWALRAQQTELYYSLQIHYLPITEPLRPNRPTDLAIQFCANLLFFPQKNTSVLTDKTD